jgi:hypothetical protein
MHHKCKHFRIEELVPMETFEAFGRHSWAFLSPRALMALDSLRELFDAPITVNNWLWGGPFNFRGLRPKFCTVGSPYSQHRLGNAFDCDIKGVTAAEARLVILDSKNLFGVQHINAIEADVNWLHFDCRNIPYEERIKIVRP